MRAAINPLAHAWLRRTATLWIATFLALSWQPLAQAVDGPNLEGTWKISAPQSSFKPEKGAIPFTADGRRRYEQNKQARGKREYEAYDYAMARCSSPGIPRLMLTPDRFRIWQRAGLVAFQFEWNRLARHIDLGGLIPQTRLLEDDEYVGRAVPISKGRWEGDTLVLTTTGFSGNTLIDDLVPLSDQLKLTERLRLTDADTLEDRITLEDANYFTRPWQTVVTYKRQPDGLFREDICLDRIASGQPAIVAN